MVTLEDVKNSWAVAEIYNVILKRDSFDRYDHNAANRQLRKYEYLGDFPLHVMDREAPKLTEWMISMTWMPEWEMHKRMEPIEIF